MSAHPPLSPTEALEQDLLKRLGLPPTASQEEISAAHQAVVAYLSSAPHDLAGWARAQAAGADEAYALLTDPAALASSAALAENAARLQVPPGGSATPPARRATETSTNGKAQPAAKAAGKPAAKAAASKAAGDATEADARTEADDEEFEALLAAVTPSAHRDAVPSAPKGAAPHGDGDADEMADEGDEGEVLVPEVPAPRRGGFPMKRAAIAGAMVVGAIAIALVGYNLGGGGAADAAGGDTANAGTGADTAGTALDTEAVAALMERIQTDPNDIDALMQLGDQFYVAGDYATAASWFAKAAEVDPAETKALLALGAAQFNQGNLDDAETAWLKVLEIDENNVEAHYDLGFLYLNQQPPDMEGVKREWTLVVTLAPDTDIAQTVQAHLDAFEEASPEASAAPSTAPSAAPGSAAPASPAPSGSVEP